MLPGVPLVLIFALFLFSAAGFGLIDAAKRDYPPPPGAPPRVSSIAPRCYYLDFRQLPAYALERQPPRYVQLLPTAVGEPWAAGWYRAAHTPQYFSTSPRWRPAGADSLDISFPGWPIGLRFRVHRDGLLVSGRALVSTDVFGPANLASVVAMPVLCPGAGGRW